jgi:hypothetical protein
MPPNIRKNLFDGVLVILIKKKIIPGKRMLHLLMPLSAFMVCLILLAFQLYIELNKIFNFQIFVKILALKLN